MTSTAEPTSAAEERHVDPAMMEGFKAHLRGNLVLEQPAPPVIEELTIVEVPVSVTVSDGEAEDNEFLVVLRDIRDATQERLSVYDRILDALEEANGLSAHLAEALDRNTRVGELLLAELRTPTSGTESSAQPQPTPEPIVPPPLVDDDIDVPDFMRSEAVPPVVEPQPEVIIVAPQIDPTIAAQLQMMEQVSSVTQSLFANGTTDPFVIEQICAVLPNVSILSVDDRRRAIIDGKRRAAAI